jgi:hypothetical protein
MDFVDRCNPTEDEIRRWANTPDAMYPMQDWDLVLASEPSRWNLFFELAADPSCPKRDAFVRLLYLIVGDAVRGNWVYSPRPAVEALIARGDGSPLDDLELWARRAGALLRDPALFDYEAWCCGGLARKPPP